MKTDFIDLVRRMRKAQRGYFLERLPSYLREAKRLERVVDRAVARHYGPRAQPTLFDRPARGEDVNG